jgi:ABC-type polysaccharide/polyol phosphate export permease
MSGSRSPSGSGTPGSGTAVLAINGPWTPPGVLLRQIVAARDLCITLARKDFVVRYRRAVFGIGWAVALPLLQAVVLSAVIGRVTTISLRHFSVYVLAGVIAWTFFVVSIGTGATAIVDNSALSSRIYFPRAVLPIAACVANVAALVIGVLILLAACAIEGVPLGLRTLLLVPACAELGVVTVGFALVLSAVHVYFRDIRYAVQAALFVWFYVTPVFYPESLLHGSLRAVVALNPVTGPVELFHAATVGGHVLSASAAIACGAWMIVLLTASVALHSRHDRVFADLL